MTLNYVIRSNVSIIVQTNMNLLDDYVDRTPFTTSVFSSDASKLCLYIFLLISENAVSEQEIIPHKDADDGRVDYFSLQEFYEGVGSNAKTVLTDKKEIQELFYEGENPPQMW